MKKFKVERNRLDYILTDMLPVELPQLFTFNNLYLFLDKKHKEIEEVIAKLNDTKYNINNNNKQIMLFKHKLWNTAPLKFSILKHNNKYRQLSIVNPISAINVYLFLELYQKEILNLLEKKSVYSIRFHTKNNNLFYMNKTKDYIEYNFLKSKKFRKRIVEQTGTYFKIKKYNSLNSFMESKLWYYCTKKYKYFGKCDYKSCFDSIYTHVYKWISAKNVVDSKDYCNSNLYTVIDRIMQNINNSTSNGILVGPEFSRMIAELLLQQIDVEVYEKLIEENLRDNEDYIIFRYVDDIFIFAYKKEIIEKIIQRYEERAGNYLLKLNEQKMEVIEIPFISTMWLSEASHFSNDISSLFYKKEDLKIQNIINKESNIELPELCYLKKYINFGALKRNFNEIICHFPDKKSSIVSFALQTFLNKLDIDHNDIKVFPEKISDRKLGAFLDLIFYCYSFYPSYENTQKLISILNSISQEHSLKENNLLLRKVIKEYSSIIVDTNVHDVINLILLMTQYEINFNVNEESILFNKVVNSNDPLLIASYLIYSSYNIDYKSEILIQVEKIIDEKISNIIKFKEIMTYEEFWYILIFYDNPDLSSALKIKMKDIINKYKVEITDDSSASKINKLFLEFIDSNDKLFFIWDFQNVDLEKEIAYRTYQRSIFKKYGKKKYPFYIGSID